MSAYGFGSSLSSDSLRSEPWAIRIRAFGKRAWTYRSMSTGLMGAGLALN